MSASTVNLPIFPTPLLPYSPAPLLPYYLNNKYSTEHDISGADIRGTNFRGASLRGAKFQGARAGLQKRWVVVLLVGVFVLVGLSAFLNLFISYFTLQISSLDNRITDWVSLIVIITFWIALICQGIENSAITFAVAFVVAFAVAVAGAVAATVDGAGAGAFAFAVAGVFAFAFAFTFAFAFALTFAFTFAFAVAEVFAFAFAFALTFAFAFVGAFTVAGAFAFFGALFQILFSSYVADQAIKGDEKYTFIHNIAIVSATIGGSSFSGADLTDTDFTNATLKSTDFRGANITRTCWRNTIKLDRIRPGETHLKDAKIRELVRTGEGQDKDFNRLVLRGINLKEANLQDASFIGTDLNHANLQNANLSRAKLVQTLLEGADLTRVTLTGAYIEDWGISHTTKLIDINCDYIFLKLPTKLAPDPQRRPADPEKYFKPGEFAKLAQKIPNTVDLIFKDGIDWQTFLKTFEELRVESETEELPVIQTIENKGDGAFVIRVKVPDQIDEAEYERKFWQKYKPMLELKDREIKLLSEQKDFYSEEIKVVRKENTRLIGIVETMAEKEGTKFDLRGAKLRGDVFGGDKKSGKDQISGNQYNYSTNPETKQNLAEAAQEIQDLLKQLEQSNPTETTAGQMTVAAQAIEIIENKPTLKQRVIGVLKSAGTEALKEAIDNPVANVLVAAFQGWIEP
ncbi:MAG: pentapeptide repeat-containing protein [Cyanobacteriota bacterium]|nr:pentapeptide repeat-containing protein [Cyanobacteriota bacterium]